METVIGKDGTVLKTNVYRLPIRDGNRNFFSFLIAEGMFIDYL